MSTLQPRFSLDSVLKASTQKIVIPANFHPVGKLQDELALLAFVLLNLTVSVRERLQGFYVPFGTTVWWYPLFGRNYVRVKAEAERQRLIECNESYSTTNFSKSVRLCHDHRSGSLVHYTIRKPSVLRRLRNWKKLTQKRLGPAGKYLRSCFDHFRLSVKKSHMVDQHIQTALLIAAIQSGFYFASRCEYGRFHSTFTGLPKKIRQKMVSVVGLETVEIDVANCQPLLLGLVVKNEIEAEDVRKYLELCTAGKIYDCFCGSVPKVKYVGRDGKTRSRRVKRGYAKELFLKMTFGNHQQTVQNPLLICLKKNSQALHII